MEGEVREYPGRKLFDFIDGAGEVHMTYNFLTAVTADYVNDQDQYMTVSSFQVASAADAYGLNSYYSPTRGKPVEVGNDGKLLLGTCRFWKGPYYVSVEGDPVGELDAVAEGFARLVAGKIPEGGSPPALLDMLPEEGQSTNPVIFLHRPLILSGLSFQAVAVGPGALGLNEQTDMVVAYYEDRFALSVTRYPEAESARRAAQGYAEAVASGALLAEAVGPYLVATTSAKDAARSAFEEAVSRARAQGGR